MFKKSVLFEYEKTLPQVKGDLGFRFGLRNLAGHVLHVGACMVPEDHNPGIDGCAGRGTKKSYLSPDTRCNPARCLGLRCASRHSLSTAHVMPNGAPGKGFQRI